MSGQQVWQPQQAVVSLRTSSTVRRHFSLIAFMMTSSLTQKQ